jgi:putative transcriptional regulator
MTMTIRHHITDSLLMAYSAGQLPEAFNLVVATHLSMCDECRVVLGGFDAVGGALVDGADQVPVSDTALDATLAMIAAQRPVADDKPVREAGIFPAPLADYVGGDLGAVKWRALGMGVRQAILPTAKGASVRLLHIPAGQAMPDHGHRGMELTLVLQGAFSDGTGRYNRGDVDVETEVTQHTPVAEAGLPCICLSATDAPLRFTGFIPRILQPLFRI